MSISPWNAPVALLRRGRRSLSLSGRRHASDSLKRTRLYSPFTSEHALEPPAALYEEPSPDYASREPQWAGSKYPEFRGDVWQYSAHLRKGAYPWDDPVQKRQFGEVVHPDYQATWVFSPEVHASVSAREIATGQFAFFGFLALVGAAAWYAHSRSPLVAKELPHDGLRAERGELSGVARAAPSGDGQYLYSDDDDEDE